MDVRRKGDESDDKDGWLSSMRTWKKLIMHNWGSL